MTATIKFRYDIVKRAADSQKAAERKTLDAELKTKTAEVIRATEELELRTRPVPFKIRLIACLESIKPGIQQGIAGGTIHYSGRVENAKCAELLKLSKEPEASKYITVFPRDGGALMADGRVMQNASFDVSPEILR